jgi:sarcosine oxidase subunit beta
MFSPRGLLMLCQTEHELRAMKRTSHANRLAGLDCRMIGPADVKGLVPIINDDPGARYPILGAYYQPRGGTARHDAVAWGYARAADGLGVDIIQNCEVTGIYRQGGRVTGLDTTRGHIRTGKIAVVAAGHSSLIAQMAGLRMPIESVCLQALVSEPIKPVIDVVVMANTVHGYMSQSDKGELVIGGGADPYNNYSQRGSFPAIEHTVTALVETFPIISRLRMMRMWGGVVDMTGDRSPIISKTQVEGLYVNCGWGTGGFKSIPGSGFVFADTVANDRPHPIAAPFSLERFAEGRLIDESVAAAVAH